jgi:hypothetical protein
VHGAYRIKQAEMSSATSKTVQKVSEMVSTSLDLKRFHQMLRLRHFPTIDHVISFGDNFEITVTIAAYLL